MKFLATAALVLVAAAISFSPCDLHTAPSSPSTATESKCTCGNPNCMCDGCKRGCRCQGPVGQCPGPWCPISPNSEPEKTVSAFAPSRTPVSKRGTRAVIDLPVELHKRNSGGMGPRGPGTGAGLCVYTSFWESVIWANEPSVFGFRDWMKTKPGGSWPEKFDETLKQYCQEQGIPIPGYIQHTGGDVEFLKQCLRTGRMPCVTYSGRDDFYPRRIAHMVNILHLDGEEACVLDNNRPGNFVWMTEIEFVERWLELGGGWAIVPLAPPPPPYPSKPTETFLPAPTPGSPPPFVEFPLPQGNPFLPANPSFPQEPLTYFEGAKKSKSTGLPLVTFIGIPATRVHGCIVAAAETMHGFSRGDIVVSKWINGNHVGVRATMTSLGTPDVDSALAQLDPANRKMLDNYGVDFSKITREKRYSHNGKECNRRQAFDAMSSVDDASSKWNLSFVGDPATLVKMRKLYAEVPATLRDRVNVQFYDPKNFQVSQFRLKEGITLREPDGPLVDRVGKEVLSIPVSDDVDVDVLLRLLDQFLNPKPPPKPSDPAPPPIPPVDPPAPSTPAEPALSAGSCLLCVLLLLFLAYKLRTKGE